MTFFPNKRFKQFGIVGIAIVAIVTAALFYQSYETNMKTEPIKIGLSEWAAYDHVFIADKKGYFKKNGVDVKLVYDSEYLVAQKRFVNGEVDGIFESMADVIYQNAGGLRPTTLVYLTDYSTTGDALISKFDSVADLQNKTISVDGFGTFSHLLVLKILEKHGMSEKDVRFEIIPAQQVLKALEEDRIQAAHTWGATLLEATKKGYKILDTAGSFPYLIVDGLAFDPEVIEERTDDIQKIIISLFEAHKFLETNPDESIRIMAEGENTSIDSIKQGLKGVYVIDLEENKQALRYDGGPLIYSIRELSDFFLKIGQISYTPTLQDLIDPRFVNNVSEG